MKAANGIIRILQQEGVEFLSVMPVGNMTRAASEESLRIIMMRNERFAVALADGYSRASNGKKIGVFNIQGGAFPVGAEIAQGAVAQAFEDSSPILGIMSGPTLDQLGQNRFDITAQYRGITKWTGYIPESRRIPEFMRRAFTYLRTGRRGPVILHTASGWMPSPNWSDYDEAEYPYTPVKGWTYPGDPRDVEVAVRALLAAKKPSIYAGQGIFYGDACDDLIEFAELVQAPVMASLLAKSVFPENHPLYLGVRDIPVDHFLGGADLVLGVGESLAPGDFKHYFDGSGKVIVQVDIDERDINTRYQVDHAVIGDAKLVLRQMIDEVKRQAGSGGRPENTALVKEIKGVQDEKSEKYRAAMESNEKPINPYRVYGDLMQAIDMQNSTVTHEAGNTRDQLSTIYEALIPRGFIGWGNCSSLGFALGAAAGAKLAYPDREVVDVTGDAGIMYQVGNYEALVRENIGITVVHLNNSGFAGYGPGFWGADHNPETSEVTSSTVLSTARMMEGLGMHSERVEEPDEVIPAIKRAIKVNRSGKPAFLEMITLKYPVFGRWMRG
jgi:thiamine pyrophosphate-dependent acetolactate synthase large subunit-like protein